ncbi:DNA recombination protein RmuC [Ornithinimicrobium sp. W1679]|uniref:DNA recombination protein RmuC n=1 Tax=Ornithinimicrobium sp. W1679 TaxID=3418770 RepID=UPI003CEEB738
MELQWWQLVALVLVTLGVGLVLGRALGVAAGAPDRARLEAERDGLHERVAGLTRAVEQDREAAAELAPLRASLDRVESQVRMLERDRVQHYGQVGEQLAQVADQTRALQEQTSALSGALSSSAVRGTWGEVQLRRVLEHAGMLARCDFDEQVSATTRHDVRVRPDVVVHLPGGKNLVIDSKAPLGAFLRAQGDGVPPDEADRQLVEHGRALRRHVDQLAAKEYWSAFDHSPELVVCFVPSDAVLAAALRAAPDLYDHAQGQRVVLASPGTLLAMLRATALAWQQDALTTHARELLRLGADLHRRLSTLGRHTTAMGTALRRSVETYNQLVGTLETRVMVTARRMHELDLAENAPETLEPLTVTPRPLTSPELLATELDDLTPSRSLEETDLPGAAGARRPEDDPVRRPPERRNSA